MQYLQNKVAIVTGGSQGIGRGVALYMAKRGASIVVCARDEAKLESVVAEIHSTGGTALGVPCHLESEADIAHVVQTAVQAFGTVDILANIGQGTPENASDDLASLSAADATFSYTTGPLASLLFMQYCFPYMKKSGGSIINVSSRYVEIGGKGFAAFGMAKSAIEALSHMAAVEWGKYGIRTNCIRPIAMHDGTNKLQKKAINAALKNKIPLGYLAEPGIDVAPVISFLAGDESRYINGEVISVDAGLSRMSSTD